MEGRIKKVFKIVDYDSNNDTIYTETLEEAIKIKNIYPNVTIDPIMVLYWHNTYYKIGDEIEVELSNPQPLPSPRETTNVIKDLKSQLGDMRTRMKALETSKIDINEYIIL